MNPQVWNDGSGRGSSAHAKYDDVAFISAIIDRLQSRYAADPNRIYVTGFSNGASMTFTAGVELSDRLAAIAPVAGHLWLLDRQLKRPLPLIFIIGTADPLEPLNGGTVHPPWGDIEQPPIESSLAAWRRMLGCTGKPADTKSGGVEKLKYARCASGAEMTVYYVDGMGHVWPGGKNLLPERMVGKDSDKLNATDVIWDFFKSHPLTGASRPK